MTLKEITSAIRNHVADGLSGQIENFSYSLDQLEEEVIIARNKLLQKYSMQPQVKLNKKYFYQTMDLIPIEEIDIALEGAFKSGEEQKGIYVPKIHSTALDDAIEFLGDIRKRKGMKVYYDTEFVLHKYRPYTSRTPYAWLDTTLRMKNNGNIIYLYNMDKATVSQYLSIRAIFSDPRDVPNGLGDRQEFPCPGWLQDEIVSSLTERYVRYYRLMNIPALPNTQSDY
jgi:hypothetical protein